MAVIKILVIVDTLTSFMKMPHEDKEEMCRLLHEGNCRNSVMIAVVNYLVDGHRTYHKIESHVYLLVDNNRIAPFTHLGGLMHCHNLSTIFLSLNFSDPLFVAGRSSISHGMS